MDGFRFPNESSDYRVRRLELLELEKDLRQRTEAVAQARRDLPLGGRLGQDYRFQRIDDSGAVTEVGFGDLFAGHDSLLLYTLMFGPDWDAPCPSCTSLVDAFDANCHPVSQRCGFAVVSAARPQQLTDWAARRGWSIPFLSAADSSYILDYFPRDDVEDPAVVSMMNVFRRTPDGIFHTWGSELVAHPMANGHPRHVDVFWPMWNLFDLLPDGRGTRSTPVQNYRHEYFTENVFREPE